MKVGSLFTGIGGLDLAFGGDVVWSVENDPAADRVLRRHFSGVRRYWDVTTMDWDTVEPVDVLIGGFPCQDISVAGRRAGIKKGTRSGLWYSYLDAVRALRPGLVVVENVAALLRPEVFDIVAGGLAEAGYDLRWRSLRAADVGAPHRRQRVFVVATEPDGGKFERTPQLNGPALLDSPFRAASGRHPGRRRGPSAHSHRQGRQGAQPAQRHDLPAWGRYEFAVRRWERLLERAAPGPTDAQGRLSADFVEWMMGFPPGWTAGEARTTRLRLLGNAVVPQQGAAAIESLTGIPRTFDASAWVDPLPDHLVVDPSGAEEMVYEEVS